MECTQFMLRFKGSVPAAARTIQLHLPSSHTLQHFREVHKV